MKTIWRVCWKEPRDLCSRVRWNCSKSFIIGYILGKRTVVYEKGNGNRYTARGRRPPPAYLAEKVRHFVATMPASQTTFVRLVLDTIRMVRTIRSNRRLLSTCLCGSSLIPERASIVLSRVSKVPSPAHSPDTPLSRQRRRWMRSRWCCGRMTKTAPVRSRTMSSSNSCALRSASPRASAGVSTRTLSICILFGVLS